MIFKVTKVVDKNPDWKVIDVLAPDNYPTMGVSVNRTNKKGETFPEFDAVQDGATIQGNLWKSDNNKWYLFAEKEKPQGNAGGFKKNIEKVMEKKEASIGKFQDNKELSIKISSTMRDAVLIALAEVGTLADHESYSKRIEYWREWLWKHYDDHESFNPF